MHRTKRKKHSELRKGAVRIAANYTRIVVSVALGLLLMRLQYQGLGAKAFGLIGLLGSTVGIAAMIQQIVRSCVVRELAEAFHSGDDAIFRRVLNSALLLAVFAGALSLSIFATLYLLVPVLNIDAHLQNAARIFIACKAAESLIVVLVTPIRNMELVRENMIAMNFWKIADKIAYVTGAFIVFIAMGIHDPAQGVIWFGIIASSLFILTEIVRSTELLFRDRRLIPSPARIHLPTTFALLKVSAWNVCVLVAHNLHHRADAVLINLFLGARGLAMNAAWTLAINLGSQVRLLSRGMTDGVDAVAARLALTDEDAALPRFMQASTRLHAYAAAPGSVLVALLAEPILLLILGKKTDDPTVIPIAVTFIQIVSVGVAARAIAENWTRILYGAGHIRRYAPIMLLGGAVNPIIAITLFLTLPGDYAYLAAPIAFTFSITVVQCLILPLWAAPCINMSAWQMLAPALPCSFLAILCSPILIVVHIHNLITLMAVAAIYGVVYTGLCILFVLSPQERARYVKAIQRNLKRGAIRNGKPLEKRQRLDDEPASAAQESDDLEM